MRIAYVLPPTRDIGVNNLAVMRYMVSSGDHVRLIADSRCLARSAAMWSLDDFELAALPHQPVRRLAALRSSLRPGRYDVMHANNPRTAAELVTATVGTRPSIPLIYTHHQTPRGEMTWKQRLALAVVFRRANAIVAVSRQCQSDLAALMPAHASKMLTIYNSIDVARVREQACAAAAWRVLGRRPDGMLLVSVGSVTPRKNQLALVRAFAKISQQFPAALLALVGPPLDPVFFEAVGAEVNSLGLADRVFLTGHQCGVDFIAACDVFVLPSLHEAFGLVLIEAMGLSKPVIATRTEGPKEIIDDGVTGLLVQPGSVDDLARAMAQLLASPKVAVRMGRNGYERCRSLFDAPSAGEAYAALQRRLVSTRAVAAERAT